MIKVTVRLLLLCSLAFSSFSFSLSANATDYYVNPALGKDANNGTSPEQAFKSLNKVNKLKLKPGDKLLFASGKAWWGQLTLKNLNGNIDKPIIVSTYDADDTNKGKRAIINAAGFAAGITILNSRHVQVSNLAITANAGGIKEWLKKAYEKSPTGSMRIGVLLEANRKGTYQGINLDNLLIRDIYFNEPGIVRSKKETGSANGTESYGWGIRAFARNGGKFDGLTINNSVVTKVSHTGIKLNGPKDSLKNVVLSNNKVFDIGGPGMQMSGGRDVHVYLNIVKDSGSTSDTRHWGRGSGMWTWGTSHALIEYNKFLNANGPADSAGFHIDFNCDNIIIQYNISANNAGGFIEILGNNYNNAYRYNVSINDGHRIKGKNNAFQEGKTFWFSGFVGKGKEHSGPFNSYIYNNTIYVKEEILSKMAVTRMSKGALIANNIFHVMGKSKAVKGDQYRPETKGINHIKNVNFVNNIFLKESTWPDSILIQDSAPIIGDVTFANPGGAALTDYIPQNKDLVANKGIEIPFIEGDKDGLFKGFKMAHDILGNPIVGKPDMGAIEISTAE
ncbi:right-handed parallel beta-helix repeat-containing protein [Thalassotalea crassostreae]|uniref:right-handed parallel beta-helix repeat-containing protein n=1 Tax=Thalassotalea crassostreae TaxID=1763536 RepID=UPI0008397CB2|nr:right-handed parallel beta-helix repeat-containing protein [Thalassotalea crassostreae]